MLIYIIIAVVSLLVAGITLFSGFGLGTALLPVYAIFFPLNIAIAATAIVHLANNIVKGIMVGKDANFKITLLFTLPAAAMAFLGAYSLSLISDIEPVYSYTILGKGFEISIIKLVIGIVMIIAAIFELSKKLSDIKISRRFIPVGGALSGFVGGLSGHQGAFRSLFLLKAGLTKKEFIGTTVLSAIIVDIVRITVYGFTIISQSYQAIVESDAINYIITGIVFAFIGVVIGTRFIKKITIRFIQILVGILLLIIAIGLMSGLI